MANEEKIYSIIGTGGFAKEACVCLIDQLKQQEKKYENKIIFIEEDSKYENNTTLLDFPIIKQSDFSVLRHKAFIAIGDSKIRANVVETLPGDTEYFSIIHPTAVISEWVKIGQGSIITAGCIITCDVEIGQHAHINLNTTIGHDCQIDDYFTTAPGVNISGLCNFGQRVYFGSNSSVRQGISICDDVTIGMGAVAVKNIQQPGVYIGCPAKKIS